MKITTIEWKNSKVKFIDQTKLPQKLEYIYIDKLNDLWQAIKMLKVRGAPALGAAAALGVYLGIKDVKAKDFNAFIRALDKAARYIAGSRPTARNLFWGLERARRVAQKNKDRSLLTLKKLILKEARKIIAEDRLNCRRLAGYGSKLIRDKDTILTICNAGILATIDYGTALGVIYRAKKEGKRIKVFACETRPLLQGSRLSAWELKQSGINVTVICDNMAASLMQQGKIDKVIAGADRIATNGDTANKIGTYSLAVLSKYHNIPFYIAAPDSTFDFSIHSGKDIPIEERNSREVSELLFRKRVAPAGAKVFNPAFDVTPHNLISAIITDKGVIRPPYGENIKRRLGKILRKR
ncbi:MAG: S-methyl-5-thioribose-1-phosphate isomerase [Candidatus Omnitrophica bacterium]|nr:S-methyl-5-thioribose-1-phosphate isomerase [Candidatus Omnitrophota bacterium]MDD5027476.1 S-methyl-5-thioribose-1-phosphate isomerase [Candidatus Omnitrophota bacterium]MDD5662404.1 S-methyl-5-thioribose-1-phosphate isomerase [Candidatus Omnitrophota bacterium]